jgi:hypothetical protein
MKKLLLASAMAGCSLLCVATPSSAQWAIDAVAISPSGNYAGTQYGSPPYYVYYKAHLTSSSTHSISFHTLTPNTVYTAYYTLSQRSARWESGMLQTQYLRAQYPATPTAYIFSTNSAGGHEVFTNQPLTDAWDDVLGDYQFRAATEVSISPYGSGYAEDTKDYTVFQP